jgi:hypothetical protein
MAFSMWRRTGGSMAAAAASCKAKPAVKISSAASMPKVGKPGPCRRQGRRARRPAFPRRLCAHCGAQGPQNAKPGPPPGSRVPEEALVRRGSRGSPPGPIQRPAGKLPWQRTAGRGSAEARGFDLNPRPLGHEPSGHCQRYPARRAQGLLAIGAPAARLRSYRCACGMFNDQAEWLDHPALASRFVPLGARNRR